MVIFYSFGLTPPNVDCYDDESSELGDNLPYFNLGPATVVKIWHRYNHTCMLLSSGDIESLGENAFGTLDYDDTTKRRAPQLY